MRRGVLLALAALGCAGASGREGTGAPAPAARRYGPPTPAEAASYQRTSRYAEVVAYLDALQAEGVPFARGEIGRSYEGRSLPYVVLSRPLVHTPEEARRLGRPIVWLQANIHGGEVEGKEALLALVRDLARAPAPNVLDSVVVVAQPIYNADGNERWGPQARNRPSQNGPEQIGRRANAQGFDLNRDYIKAEAPETRAALAAFAAWDPDVFVDLHTTNGSYHGYALTYSPSLYPGLPAAELARDSLLPVLRERMQERHGFATFDYGNFSNDDERPALTDSVKTGWWTYDWRPRYGSNYYALRGRVSILSEAYSHDPLERRVAVTYAFAREILSLAAERQASLRRLRADTLPPSRLALRAAFPDSAPVQPVVAEVLEAVPESLSTEPGVPAGVRRTGRFHTLQIPVHDRFVPTLEVELPEAWAIPAADTAVVAELKRHGVRVYRLYREWRGRVETFTIDSIVVAPREFQGHREVRLEGRWHLGNAVVHTGAYVVPARQPLGALAAVLLEPQSADGLVTWNRFDGEMRPGWAFPVFRVRAPIGAWLQPVP